MQRLDLDLDLDLEIELETEQEASGDEGGESGTEGETHRATTLHRLPAASPLGSSPPRHRAPSAPLTPAARTPSPPRSSPYTYPPHLPGE